MMSRDHSLLVTEFFRRGILHFPPGLGTITLFACDLVRLYSSRPLPLLVNAAEYIPLGTLPTPVTYRLCECFSRAPLSDDCSSYFSLKVPLFSFQGTTCPSMPSMTCSHLSHRETGSYNALLLACLDGVTLTPHRVSSAVMQSNALCKVIALWLSPYVVYIVSA